MRRCELVGWAKVMIAVAFAMGAVFCFLICPKIGKQFADAYPEISYLFWPCLIFVWATAVPFAVALVQSWKICNAVQTRSGVLQPKCRTFKAHQFYGIFRMHSLFCHADFSGD